MTLRARYEDLQQEVERTRGQPDAHLSAQIALILFAKVHGDELLEEMVPA